MQDFLPDWLGVEFLEADCEGDGAPAAAEVDPVQPDPQEYFLPHALAVPGLNHIVENMCSDCNTAMQGWGSWIVSLKPLVSMLHHEYLRNKFVATCIRDTRHAWMESRFKKGLPKFAEWRWGSTVSVLTKLMPLRRFLQASWDPNRYRSGDANAGQAEGEAGLEEADVPQLTEAIRSNWFWSFGSVILMLNSVSANFASWAEGCPCHPFACSKSVLPQGAGVAR